MEENEIVRFTPEQARKLHGIRAALMQPVLDKLAAMAETRETTVDEVYEVLACFGTCTRNLTLLFGATEAFGEGDVDDMFEALGMRRDR